jgi:signal transduction histidine kinase/ActR/RegA family two-component response regulator
MISIRLKILIVALASMLAAMATFTGVMIHSTRESSQAAEVLELDRLVSTYNESVALQQKACQAILQTISHDAEVQRAIASRDRDRLLALLQPVLTDLRSTFNVVQLFVHDPDGVVFLRVHDPSARGDSYVIDRRLVADAIQERRPVSGLELDAGKLSQRTVVPLVGNGRLVGLLEIGLDHDQQFLDQLKRRRDADYRLWVTYKAAGPTGVWPAANAPASPSGDLFVYASTFGAHRELPQEAYEQVTQSNRSSVYLLEADGEPYSTIVAPLLAYRGQLLGLVEISKSRAQALVAFRESLVKTLMIASLVAAGGIVLLALTMTYMVVRPLRRLTAAARQQYEGNLSARVDYTAADEFGLLANTFNRLSNRLTETLHDQQRSIEDLSEARRSAEEANATKDQFLAALSHELRTPLTPVLLAAQALENSTDLPQGFREDAHTIRRNVELEARLIDDLLDLARITRGKLVLHPQTGEVHTLIAAAMRVCRKEIEAKHLNIKMDMAASEQYVHADPARLQQVFWNLIKNAVKFTPEMGMICVSTSNEKQGETTMLAVRVCDTGIGMAPETIERLFRFFEQGARSITRSFGGLGLGLAISRAIVAAHHGTVTAQSEGLGKGSTFTVMLPTVPAPATPEAVAPRPGISAQLKLHVLLVEDHPPTAKAVARLLKSWGHQVVTASTVACALEAAAKQPFDLIISDLGLPDGHGTELMKRLQACTPMPGIAVSGYGMQEDIDKSLAAGFVTHLTKPITTDQLQAAVAEAMGARQEHPTS